MVWFSKKDAPQHEERQGDLKISPKQEEPKRKKKHMNAEDLNTPSGGGHSSSNVVALGTTKTA